MEIYAMIQAVENIGDALLIVSDPEDRAALEAAETSLRRVLQKRGVFLGTEGRR